MRAPARYSIGREDPGALAFSKRPNEERIATNVLRDRLNTLVERGMLTKSDDPERKGRTRYALTERAITLVPVLVHLGHWGERWLPADPALRRVNRRLFAGGPPLWETIMDELRA